MIKQSISLSQTTLFLRQDFSRYTSTRNPLLFLAIFLHNSGMIFSLLYRLERYCLYGNMWIKPIGLLLYPVYFFITYYILDYHIEPGTHIKGGLVLHNRHVVITEGAILGSNISIMDSVTIGVDFIAGGTITIGNNVQIGTGAKIIAKKHLVISSNVTIGANAVVVRSITTKGSYGGIPARLLKRKK